MIDVHELLKVPYVDRGRTMEGLDCRGQLLLVRDQLGMPSLPDICPVSRAEQRATEYGCNGSYTWIAFDKTRANLSVFSLHGDWFGATNWADIWQ